MIFQTCLLWYKEDMKQKSRRTQGLLILLTIFAISSVLLSSCMKKTGSDPTIQGGRSHSHIIMAIPVDPDGLDPQRTAAASTFQITSNIYETLVTVDEQGNVVPALAESWSVSDDGLEIDFTLRENAVFSNGKPCDSAAVIASFERLMDPTSPRRDYYSLIESIEAIDDRTVRFRYSSLDVVALSNFCYSWAAIVDVSQGDELRMKPVGTGAYKLQSWIAQQDIVLVRNESYPGFVGVDKVEFVIMPDIASQISSFLNGEIDIMLITGDQLPAIDGKGEYNLIESPGNGVQLMAMNLANEALSDIRVRQAINLAVDKQAVIDAVWWGYGIEIGSHYPVVLPEYVDLSGTYGYDPESARKLLEEAGYGNGLKLRLSLPKSYQEYVNAGIVIADQLKKVGIECSIEIVEWSDWLERVYTGRDYDLTVVGHTGRLDPYGLLQRYTSTSGENYFNYSNKRVDEILALYQKESDGKIRTELVEELQRILANDVPALYLQDPIMLYVTQKDVEGFVTYPIELYDMKRITIGE